jgi:cell shape-determining protein MreC
MRKEEYEREVEEMSVFKSFLRSLMRQLKALEKALLENDTQKAKKIVSEIIEDTQKGIED